MLEYSYLIQGYILGFSVATTIGISGVLCLQNMMTGRISVALSSVLAVSLADMACAMLVVFGLQSGQEILIAYKTIFTILTGIFLCGLGLHKMMSKLVLHSGHKESGNALIAFGTIFFLAMVDPVSILDFMALCMGLTLDFSVLKNAFEFVLGLFLGSLTWWLGLCSLILFFRTSLSAMVFQRIQQIAGVGIFAFGVWTLKDGIALGLKT